MACDRRVPCARVRELAGGYGWLFVDILPLISITSDYYGEGRMDNVTLRHLPLTCSCSILELANALSATFKGLTLDLQKSVGYKLQVSNIYPAISIPSRVCGVEDRRLTEDCRHYGTHASGLNQLSDVEERGTWPGSRKLSSCLCTPLARMILPARCH